VQQCSADPRSTQRYELQHQRHRELRKGLSTILLPIIKHLSLPRPSVTQASFPRLIFNSPHESHPGSKQANEKHQTRWPVCVFSVPGVRFPGRVCSEGVAEECGVFSGPVTDQGRPIQCRGPVIPPCADSIDKGADFNGEQLAQYGEVTDLIQRTRNIAP
jgi:hypothetical protein